MCALRVVSIFLSSFSSGLVKIIIRPSVQAVVGIIASVVRHVMYGIPDAKERRRVGNPKARAYDVSTQVASIRIAPDVMVTFVSNI